MYCIYCTFTHHCHPPPLLWSSRAATPDPTVRMARSTPRIGLCPGYNEGGSCAGKTLRLVASTSFSRGRLSHEDARRLKMPLLGVLGGSVKRVREDAGAGIISLAYCAFPALNQSKRKSSHVLQQNGGAPLRERRVVKPQWFRLNRAMNSTIFSHPRLEKRFICSLLYSVKGTNQLSVARCLRA